MPELIELTATGRPIKARIKLPLSKSISNRAAVLDYLSKGKITSTEYAEADDTRILRHQLVEAGDFVNAGAGGTTFRFLMAALAMRPGFQGILSGTPRLLERPILELVQALRSLGASIEEVNQQDIQGWRIHGQELHATELVFGASASSQFASALALIAPFIDGGLSIRFEEKLPSQAYFQMTLAMLVQAGIHVEEVANVVHIAPWEPRVDSLVLRSEADWSSASYWYGFVALQPGSELILEGADLDSLQTDVACIRLFELLGVQTEVHEQGLRIWHVGNPVEELVVDISAFPDLFPTLAMVGAGLRIRAIFSGLGILKHKESDRVKAVSEELAKLKCQIEFSDSEHLMINAKDAQFHKTVVFASHEDHRMAMACAMLSPVLWRCAIRDPHVVTKSYPQFWQQLGELGIDVQELES